jgi:cardiolipin synthase C
VNIESALADVLQRLSDGQLEALATACRPLAAPTGGLGQVVAGAPPSTGEAVAALAAAWGEHPELTGAGVALALRVGLAARLEAGARRSRPVWTGPGTVGEQRLTAAVLHELIAGSRERILLISYAAYTLPEIATDLEAAVARGCQVDVVFETTEDSAGGYTGPTIRPFDQVAGIDRWRWPATNRDGGAVLHAKLLVIDGQRALVSSANLTARALHHNLEVGVLTHDADLATQLEDHIRRLMSAGVLSRDAEG